MEGELCVFVKMLRNGRRNVHLPGSYLVSYIHIKLKP